MIDGPTTSPPFTAWPLADHGVLCEFGSRIEPELGQRIAWLADSLLEISLPGLVDAVPSYTSLLLMVDPGTSRIPVMIEVVAHLWEEIGTRPISESGRVVTIPVAYGGHDGPDLADVARQAGLEPNDVVRRHQDATYRVGAIGFAPGFAYLTGLPPELATPRRSTPRVRVPVGSVGIGGAQTGVYTCPTPGGWSLIGRTELRLFDPERDPPALLAVGDHVRFADVDGTTFRTPTLTPPHRATSQDRAALEVLQPGMLTTVQDLGRPGYGRIGVAPGGAADRMALIRGNRLLGNPDGATGLEMTINGPHIRFLRHGRIVVSGANLGARLNGVSLAVDAVRVVRPGDELTFGGRPRQGARAWLCVAGGIDVPERLGSRSTDLVGGFGGHEGRPLRRGDRLATGPSTAPWARIHLAPDERHTGPIRITRGPQANRFGPEAWRALLEREFRVSPDSNRQGIRLDGPPILPFGSADIISQGVVTGAIQITGSGQPIVMLPARATIGGYPQIATVIDADLDRLGQVKPGDTVRFTEDLLDQEQANRCPQH